MNIHFILHESFEAPGAYLTWAQECGHTVTTTKVYEYECLPQSSASYDMLIVMGGPQSPDENEEKFPYYHPQDEIAFIQQFVAEDKPIVGVCLGAQLLSHAYGAHYEHSPEREIGSFPITLTKAGLADEHLQHFGQELVVGHWHGDMPGLSADAEILATSEGCPRQIVKFGSKQYAFQCHLELNDEVAPLLIAAEENLEADSQTHRFIDNAETILDQDYRQMNQALYGFLDKLTQ